MPRLLAGSGTKTRRIIGYSYASTTLLAVVLGLAFVVIAPLVNDSFSFVRAGTPALLLVLGTAAWTLFSLQDGVLTGLRQTRWVLAENLAFGLLKIVALVGFAAIAPLSGIPAAWVLTMLATLLPINWLIFTRLAPEHALMSVDAPESANLSARALGSFIGWDFVGSLVSQLYTAAIPLLVFSHFGSAAYAPFAISWTMAMTMDMVGHNLAASLTVEGSRNPAGLAGYTRRMAAIGTALMLAASIVVWAAAHFAPDILTAEYRASMTYLPVVVLSSLPRLLLYLPQARWRTRGRTKDVALAHGVAAALTWAAAYVALRLDSGPMGVAWACVIGPTVVALALLPQTLRRD